MRNFSFQLVCLLSVSTLTVACGKKVENVKNGSVVEGQEVVSNTLSIFYHHFAFTPFITPINRNANFKIPKFFSYEASEEITKDFEILFNFTRQPFSYEFKCVYQANNEARYFYLDHCSDFSGQNIGSVTGVDFILDAGKDILMQSAETNEFETNVNFQINWK